MSYIIEFIIEVMAELFLGKTSERARESIRDKRIKRQIQKLNKQQEWFRLLYAKDGYKEIIDRHPDIHMRIMDKFYIRRVNQDIGEQNIFDMYIRSKIR